MKKNGLGKRHVQYSILFFGGLIAFTIRTSLSVAIVAMIQKDPPFPNIKTYPDWKNKDVILSSFFWGYVILQIPAGLIGFKYGPKYILGTSFTIASIFTLLVPFMAETMGSRGVILSRVMQGLSQGFLFPSTHNILSKWTPLPERSRTFSFVYSSVFIGCTMALPVTGYICNSSYGWPMVFYLSGTLGLLWSFSFLWFCKNSPQEDPSISNDERIYLEQNIKTTADRKKLKVPWKSIFTSIPFWAICVAHFGNNYGFFTLLTEMPSFMQGVFKFDMEANSLLSALPFLACFIVSSIMSPISDYLISQEKLSIQTCRKIFNCIGMTTPAITLSILAFIPPEMKYLGVLLLVISVGINAGIFVGFNLNHADIAPNYAGVLMGFTNFCGQISSILGPLVVQVLVKDQTDPFQWRIVFIIAAGLLLVTNIFFLIFASGEIQPWNNENLSEQKDVVLPEYVYVPIKREDVQSCL
ncbi:hypothetical protein HHI36_014086 [Cryptolaemus montrouzieri]|uniref:Putative inorganic phosphate cotransporter n=1 Tax=Cryptolaemus montrouzieri TaxID=559131 RepID=A0ABD2N1S6_9CUCU